MSARDGALHVMSVFGTRPEAIKLAPVIREMERAAAGGQLRSTVCVTAQHREMLDQVLRDFGIQPDYDLDIMVQAQTTSRVASEVLARLEPVLRSERPDWVLVQGDTTTVAAAALAAHYAGVKVGHVEAGLRSGNKWQPFPEEVNRRIATVIADLHFAPTEQARRALLAEDVAADRIVLTGNPIIDALRWIVEKAPRVEVIEALVRQGVPRRLLDPDATPSSVAEQLIVVTAHRRENFGAALEQICLALRDIACQDAPPVHIVYPVHPNPNVSGPVRRILGEAGRITLTGALDYHALVYLMQRASFVMTDSGGLQEEAPSLGKPVLVLREVTERPEGVHSGVAKLVGADRTMIVREARRLLTDEQAYASMARAVNPYGDGHASSRIVQALLEYRV